MHTKPPYGALVHQVHDECPRREVKPNSCPIPMKRYHTQNSSWRHALPPPRNVKSRARVSPRSRSSRSAAHRPPLGRAPPSDFYISIPSFVEASFQIFSLPNSRVIAKAPESQQDSRECAIPYPHKVWPTIVEHTLHEASGVGGDGTSEPVRQMTPVFALWRNRQALPHRPSTLRQAL